MCVFLVLGLVFFHAKPRDWLGKRLLKWPILFPVRRKTTTKSVNHSQTICLRCSVKHTAPTIWLVAQSLCLCGSITPVASVGATSRAICSEAVCLRCCVCVTARSKSLSRWDDDSGRVGTTTSQQRRLFARVTAAPSNAAVRMKPGRVRS